MVYRNAERRNEGLAGSHCRAVRRLCRTKVRFVGLLTGAFRDSCAVLRLLGRVPNDPLARKEKRLGTYSTAGRARRVPAFHRIPLFSRAAFARKGSRPRISRGSILTAKTGGCRQRKKPHLRKRKCDRMFSPQNTCPKFRRRNALQARTWPVFWLVHWGKSCVRIPPSRISPVTGSRHE